MHYCEYCQRGFKSIQGLGHQRMTHNMSTGQHSAEYRPSIDGSTSQYSPEVEEAREEGMKTAVAYYENITGVNELRQDYELRHTVITITWS